MKAAPSPAARVSTRHVSAAATSLVALAALLAISAERTRTQQPPTGRPDIVIVMADDLDVGSLDTAVDEGLMPNLVRYVLEAGTKFTESFVSLSLCCPSRSTFLTGLYAHNHGVVRNSGASGGFSAFQRHFDGSAPLARWLEEGGYRTAHVGKYLNGYTDYTVVPRGWTEWRALVDASTYCMYNYRISKNGTELLDYAADPSEPADEYQTDVLARLAEDIVSTSDTRPLFLSIAPLAPHRESSCLPSTIRPAPRHVGTVDLPLPAPPSFNEGDMSDKPRWMRRLPPRNPVALRALYNDRIAALRAVDDLIGTVASALRAAGRLDRTAFMFTSDNGYVLGPHRWESKILLYEESIRIPLAVRLPGGANRPTVGRFALHTDLAPTIADLARVRPDFAVDGRSLVPLVRGADPQWRQRFLVEYPPIHGSAAAALALDFDMARPFAEALPPFHAVRTGGAHERPRLVYAETLETTGALVTDRELYDLDVDPFQQQSLHNDRSPGRVLQQRVLKQHLEALKTCGAGTCQTLEE